MILDKSLTLCNSLELLVLGLLASSLLLFISQRDLGQLLAFFMRTSQGNTLPSSLTLRDASFQSGTPKRCKH
ncbi:hypothetical protein XELAEV_18030744mg [Xenopus laevis]|uniref:Uncharacterized protein n=1 Tax=Xenopus laevis TaxID=8355 RepID=A0A974CLD2_XENLA|nr:hypothetical protein XELAEV_18030744mg [Xenopus laevis]